MISELVSLPVSNVSMYDASTSAAEAITCAVRVKSKKASQPNSVYVSELVPPHRMSVIRNYTQGVGIEINLLPHNPDGTLAGMLSVDVDDGPWGRKGPTWKKSCQESRCRLPFKHLLHGFELLGRTIAASP